MLNKFLLPINSIDYEKYNTFQDYLFYLFDEYLIESYEFIKIIENLDIEKNKIEMNIQILKKVYINYVSGYKNTAYNCFSNFLDKNIMELEIFETEKRKIDFYNIKENNQKIRKEIIEELKRKLSTLYKLNYTFFRIRPEKDKTKINSSKDIFHVPFELYYLTSSQRYSLSGCPCLYLGSSKEICDIELGSQENIDLYFSEFKVIDELSYLDFTKNIDILYSDYVELISKMKKNLNISGKNSKNISINKIKLVEKLLLISLPSHIKEKIKKSNKGIIIPQNYKNYDKFCKRLKEEINLFKIIRAIYTLIMSSPNLKKEFEVIFKTHFNYLKSTKAIEKIIIELEINYDNFYLIAKEEKKFTSLLYLYPLLISTNIKVSAKHKSFKPEYIYSQMLMEWIRSNTKIDGVMYKSTKIKNEDLHNINLVIPPKQFKKTGICEELYKKFEISHPKIWKKP